MRTVELPELVAQALRRHVDRSVSPVPVDDDIDPRRPVRREALLLFRSVNAATFRGRGLHEWPDVLDRTRSLVGAALAGG